MSRAGVQHDEPPSRTHLLLPQECDSGSGSRSAPFTPPLARGGGDSGDSAQPRPNLQLLYPCHGADSEPGSRVFQQRSWDQGAVLADVAYRAGLRGGGLGGGDHGLLGKGKAGSFLNSFGVKYK